MGRVDIIDILYTKNKSSLEFSFENLTARPLLSLLTIEDINQLRYIATSIRLSSKPKEKYKMIDNILVPRGFKQLSSGTNRVVYKFLEDQSIVIKVAIDKVGMGDNPKEYHNQFLLQPFVTKVFEVSPCGTVGLFERVVPITSREEYLSVSDDVFDMIVSQIIGKYVAEDIGTQYFQNIGVRPGVGVVLLDFPYIYELDGNKLYCNRPDPITNIPCGGEIDYDSGFNKLICTKCGKRYYAREMSTMVSQNKIVCRKKGGSLNMKIVIKKGNDIVKEMSGEKSADVLPTTNKSNDNKSIKVIRPKKVSLNNKDYHEIKEEKPETKEIDFAVTGFDINENTNKEFTGRVDNSMNKNMSTNDYKNNVPEVFTTPEDENLPVVDVEEIVIDTAKKDNDESEASNVSDNY